MNDHLLKDSKSQIEAGRTLAIELTNVLRKIKQLNGHGEKAISEVMLALPDAQDLCDKLASVKIGYKPSVDCMIPSYLLRSRPDEEYPKGELDTNIALSMLLLNEVVFTNEHHWMENWPEEAKRTTYLGVICNDVFAWGCADVEALRYSEIEEVFDYWEKDPLYGTAIWSIIKRQELPQKPVLKRITDSGIWDMDSLTKEHGLKANYYDGISMTIAQQKRDAYLAWCEKEGTEPLPFDSGWWTGWQEYVAAHPEWYSEEWKTLETKNIEQWKTDNGHTAIDQV